MQMYPVQVYALFSLETRKWLNASLPNSSSPQGHLCHVMALTHAP
jgi:hypothetical protein